MAACLVMGGVSNYGNLDFGTQSALATNTAQVQLSGGMQLQCTPGVTLSISDGFIAMCCRRSCRGSTVIRIKPVRHKE